MKTSIKIIAAVTLAIMCLNANAQRSHNGTQNQPNHQPQTAQNNNQTGKHHGWASNNHHGPNWGGNVIVHIGGHPHPYYNNYSNGYGYNNYYNVKKASRNSIRQSANIIGQALQFSDWNDTYSPWLAKAIRHQQYAKQLYFWGDYAGALNHAERAGFLAWNTLDYFNNPYSYNNNNYPDPYSNPNNPYYRKNNSNPQPEGSDDNYGYRKGTTNSSTESASDSKEENPGDVQRKAAPELEKALPQSKMNDKELLKTSPKDLDIE
ncbi:MAG: hypothetical protein K0S53_3105 [Bacteroidetes bacterium]|jgi:hypothetical protein|nr:hypothetical protein [Bacteroidota bacterium]MDF2451924.1 hypothetical protein [Bacteroidota bacterium]